MTRSLRRAGDAPMEFDVEGDLSLYPPGSDQAVVLNRTASDIWRRLADPTPLPDLVAALAEAYGQSTPAIAADVAALVDVLIAQGLVVLDDTPD
jgi:hypothetical protein